jgi:hypothetical protein
MIYFEPPVSPIQDVNFPAGLTAAFVLRFDRITLERKNFSEYLVRPEGIPPDCRPCQEVLDLRKSRRLGYKEKPQARAIEELQVLAEMWILKVEKAGYSVVNL